MMDASKEKTAADRTKSYEKRATRRKIRALHAAISKNNIDEVKELITPDVDVNFHYGGQSALQIAVNKGFEDICRLLIKHGADVNKCNVEDNSLLNMAAWGGHVAICQLLIDGGAELDVCNNFGSSPIASAAYKGHADVVRLLIKADCNIDCPNIKGQSPLCIAASHGNTDVVKALIEGGCDLNWVDKDGRTALYTAAEKGNSLVVKALVKAKGCDLNIREKYGSTAVRVAAKEGHKEIVDSLIEAGANLNIADSRGVSPVMEAVRNHHLAIVKALTAAKCDVNITEVENKQAPIHAAVRIATQFFGPKDMFTDMVETLISAGCNLDLGDKVGYTPLYQAAFGGEVDIVSLLLRHNCSVDSRTTNGNTVLHAAAFGNKIEIFNKLLDAGCNVNTPNLNNELPLYTAVDFRAKPEIVQCLLAAGSRTDVCQQCSGQSPLFAAINTDYTEAVNLLIKAGATVNEPNLAGDTPLWVACNKGNITIVKHLLQQPGIDINAGISHIPLHAAAVHGHYDIAETLLKAGADVNKLTELCVSALYLAADSNHANIVELLVRHGANPSIQHTVTPPQMCCRYYRDKHPHLENEPLYAAVKNDNFHVIKMILLATPRMPYHVITTLRDLIFRTGFVQQARLSQTTVYQYATFFATILRTPASLQTECRGVIRSLIGSKCQASKIDLLPLPNKLKDFLLFKGALCDSGPQEE